MDVRVEAEEAVVLGAYLDDVLVGVPAALAARVPALAAQAALARFSLVGCASVAATACVILLRSVDGSYAPGGKYFDAPATRAGGWPISWRCRTRICRHSRVWGLWGCCWA